MTFRHQFHRVLHRLGLDLVRFDGRNFPERKRAELMENLGVNVVIDVGANEGQYVREIRANGFRGTIVAFEPVHGAFDKISALAERDSKLTVHRLAIGATEGDEIIHVAANSYSSSFLPMNTAHLRAAPDSSYVAEERVAVRPLDALAVISDPDVAWLKVDAQGYESNVLAGASETLGRVAAVEVELTYVELYEGQALAWEMHTMLSVLGFDLVAFGTPFYDRATSTLLQIDGIFVRTRRGADGKGETMAHVAGKRSPTSLQIMSTGGMNRQRIPFFAYLAAKDSLSAAASPLFPRQPRVWDDSIESGIRWLCLSHDVTGRRGSSGGFSLLRGWGDAFPETTGYILQTLLEYGLRKGDPEHVERACQMGDWEIDIQNRDGGVIHGNYTGEGKPSSVFNTGMVIHGWLDLHEAGKGLRYLDAAVRAGRFLAERQDDDGIWRGEIEYNDIPHTYNARASWALLRLAEVTGEETFRKTALRQLDWVLSMQEPNGWFDWCIFRLNTQPNTHAIAYTLRGLIESNLITGHEPYLTAALTTSRALIEKLERHGKLAGNFDRAWEPAAWHECLTGTAQLGGVWMRLYEITAEQRFLEAGLKAIGIAAARQSRVDWAPVHGALAGSYPIYGRYAPFRFPNWATKFLVDGLLKRADILAETALEHDVAGAAT